MARSILRAQAPGQPLPSRPKGGRCSGCSARRVSQRFLTKTTSYFLQKLPWHEQKSLWAEDATLPLLSAGQRQPESARLQVPHKHTPETNSGNNGSPARSLYPGRHRRSPTWATTCSCARRGRSCGGHRSSTWRPGSRSRTRRGRRRPPAGSWTRSPAPCRRWGNCCTRRSWCGRPPAARPAPRLGGTRAGGEGRRGEGRREEGRWGEARRGGCGGRSRAGRGLRWRQGPPRPPAPGPPQGGERREPPAPSGRAGEGGRAPWGAGPPRAATSEAGVRLSLSAGSGVEESFRGSVLPHNLGVVSGQAKQGEHGEGSHFCGTQAPLA